MLKYILRRLAQAVPVIIATTFLTFVLLEVVPGDPITMMMKEHISPDVVARVRAQMHLDDPWLQRYGRYMWGVLHGDFGVSYKLRRDVSVLLQTSFGPTLILTVSALAVAWGIGVPSGIIAATRPYSKADNFVTFLALLGVSLPIFWLGLLMQMVFGWKLGLAAHRRLQRAQEYLIMPAICLGVGSAAVIARLIRSSMLEVIGVDYVRIARAKGLRQRGVLVRHALKNSLLPVVTVMAIQVADLLSGAVSRRVSSDPRARTGLSRRIQRRNSPCSWDRLCSPSCWW